jgi:NADPH2:quinone reductase
VKALVATEWGEPSAMVYRDTADPAPASDEVLVETRAIGCNFPDILMVQGRYQVKPPLPFSPGLEVAGVVREVGRDVTRVRPGQRALALLPWGGYAEQAVASAGQVFAIPEAMSFEDAAAFGLVYQTSYCALVHRAALRPSEWLLVHGAAGGVGLAAVQLGRTLGARVIATAGTDAKLEVARGSGAQVLINYRTEDWIERVQAVTAGEGADVIFDPVGGEVFDGSSRCIAFEGRLLVIGFAGGQIPSIAANRILLKNISVVGVHWGLYQRRGSPLVDAWMSALFELYEKHAIRPVISGRYPLLDAARALSALAGRESYGKVVLHP